MNFLLIDQSLARKEVFFLPIKRRYAVVSPRLKHSGLKFPSEILANNDAVTRKNIFINYLVNYYFVNSDLNKLTKLLCHK